MHVNQTDLVGHFPSLAHLPSQLFGWENQDQVDLSSFQALLKEHDQNYYQALNKYQERILEAWKQDEKSISQIKPKYVSDGEYYGKIVGVGAVSSITFFALKYAFVILSLPNPITSHATFIASVVAALAGVIGKCIGAEAGHYIAEKIADSKTPCIQNTILWIIDQEEIRLLKVKAAVQSVAIGLNFHLPISQEEQETRVLVLQKVRSFIEKNEATLTAIKKVSETIEKVSRSIQLSAREQERSIMTPAVALDRAEIVSLPMQLLIPQAVQPLT